MKSQFEFTLVLDGITRFTTATEGALFDAGCDDALPVVVNRAAQLDFARKSDSLSEAIASAVADVRKARIGAKVVRIVMAPDSIVLAEKNRVRRESARLPVINGRIRRRIMRDKMYAE
jgi:hypothetical protein